MSAQRKDDITKQCIVHDVNPIFATVETAPGKSL